MSRMQAWLVGAAVIIGGIAVFFAMAMLRATQQIPPAPAETDPTYDALIEQEEKQVEAIEARLTRHHREIETIAMNSDPDKRSTEISRLLNGGV